MFNKLLNFKGKRDRENDAEQQRKVRAEDYSPRDELEAAIYDNKSNINLIIKSGKKIDRHVALQSYLNARMNRHDIWVNYLVRCRMSKEYNFNDIKVLDFISKNFPSFVNELPINIKNLSPDILVYNKMHNVVYLGDVTCTNSVRDADRRKFIKYKPISDFLTKKGIKVKHQNFIVDNRLANINQVIREFENIDLIMPINNIKNRAVNYYKIAQRTMDDIIEYCEDRIDLLKTIAIEDRQEDEHYDQIILPDDIIFPELNIEGPKMKEEIIIDQIKRKTDETYIGYFDEGIKETLNAFNEMDDLIKKKEHMEPKSTLKVVTNSIDVESKTDHELIKDYVFDIMINDGSDINSYVQWLLPTMTQVEEMVKIKSGDIKSSKECGVYGPYQFTISRTSSDNLIINKTIKHLSYGKKTKNEKKEPKTLDPNRSKEYYDQVEEMISYYGCESSKPPILPDTWQSVTQLEADNSKEIRKNYYIVKKTCGAQVANSLSMFYKRMCHLKTSLSTKDNIFIPPNGSFIAIVPKDHAPVTSSTSDFPIIFISRSKKCSKNLQLNLFANEHEYKLETDDYVYYISKLCRLNINKMANWENSGHKLCAVASYLGSLNSQVDIKRIVGILTLMILDVHQKTSELLDLLKYISYMPFADITRLSTLVKDKFNIMYKTRLDIWTLESLKILIKELSLTDKINARKPKLQLHNGIAVHESFGMKMELPSFFDMKIRHKQPETYIEEIGAIFTVRGKQFYGSQFMDKSITLTAQWEVEYQEEIDKYGNWVIDGDGEMEFPFESKFAFCKDAILYAQKRYIENNPISIGKAMKDLNNGYYNEFMIYNCSLKGCTKEPELRSKPSDLHTTSMEACLKHYEDIKYDDKLATCNAIAFDMMREGKRMEFSMSEKEQRGGGRPIATPTLSTKAALMMLEKPEASIGKQCKNNVVVPGKNKLQEQSETYKKFVTQSALEGFKLIFQLTEDQTKFSEMDNPRKFKPYISNNHSLDPNVRRIQLKVVDMLINRDHLVKRIPIKISETGLNQKLNKQKNGIMTGIGWPQGMCNFMSTTIPVIADDWITYAYNFAYPSGKVKTVGLLHSDDSWLSIACNTIEDFKRFTIFRIHAKKMFCLKMNEKKLWGSRYIGELVSNYNINGNVHLCLSKLIANSFIGLTYQNWTIDVHNQVSVLQQACRQGSTIPTLILLSTILKEMVLNNYQIDGLQKRLLNMLPIELGGYPDNSAFELAVNGVNCHYHKVLSYIKQNPHSEVANIVLRCLRLSIKKIEATEQRDMDILIHSYAKTKISDEYIINLNDNSGNSLDYENVQLPYRADVFKCINHLMPQSKKIKSTIQRIKSLPFISDGLEMIVTRPKTLAEALGHIKSQTNNLLYSLAADKYTQNARRLAVSQAIQASGKTVRLDGLAPMNINTLLSTILLLDNVPMATLIQLDTSFTGSNPVPDITASIVYNSEHTVGTNDKRKIINRLPEIDDNFKTMSPIRDILLYIIEKTTSKNCYTEYGSKKSPIQLLDIESELIKKRFESFFKAYKIIEACSLVMRLSMENQKTKLWMQPYLNQENLSTFLEDLYGKTLNNVINYRIQSNIHYSNVAIRDSEMVRSIYTVLVLNSLYLDKFKILKVYNKDVHTIIREIDFSKLPIDDLLKYGIINKVLYNNDTFLEKYDQCRLFSKKYLKQQKFSNGKYYGPFICIVKYGNIVIRIEGEPGNISLTVNNLNMNEILMGMMLFINDSFPTERYNHPTSWHKCPIWANNFKIGTLFLTSYTQSSSHFTTTSNNTSVPITRNDNLRFDELFITKGSYEYNLEEDLRVVYKLIDNNKVRIGNVKQNLSCPLAKAIELEPAFLDQIPNNELLNTKIIINLTMRRPFANSKSDIVSLLSKIGFLNNGLLGYVYTNLMSKFVVEITPMDFHQMQELEIIEDNVIEGCDIFTMETIHNETDAADLTYVETNILLEEVEEVNAMVRYNNVIKYLAQCYMIHLTESDVSAILSGMLSDSSIMNVIVEDARSDDIEEKLELMRDDDKDELTMDTKCFILASDLDLISGWSKINLKDIIMNKCKGNITRSLISIYNNFKNDMYKIIFDRNVEDVRNELLKMLIEE